jgi:flagellar hook assembly protein FlgD
MRISPLGLAKAQGGADTSTAAAPNQDFMTLLIAQLQAQDPLEPLKTSDFTNQLAQLQSVSELSMVNLWLRQLVELQALGPVLSLIDRQVEWVDPQSGEGRSGTVERVVVRSDGALELIVGEDRLTLDQVVAVS